jgi:hypothetical protein
VISRRAGMSSRARPTAAQVPSTVAIRVAKMPIRKLFLIASSHLSSLKMALYQRSE